jgi:hypothetical protein
MTVRAQIRIRAKVSEGSFRTHTTFLLQSHTSLGIQHSWVLFICWHYTGGFLPVHLLCPTQVPLYQQGGQSESDWSHRGWDLNLALLSAESMVLTPLLYYTTWPCRDCPSPSEQPSAEPLSTGDGERRRGRKGPHLLYLDIIRSPSALLGCLLNSLLPPLPCFESFAHK